MSDSEEQSHDSSVDLQFENGELGNCNVSPNNEEASDIEEFDDESNDDIEERLEQAKEEIDVTETWGTSKHAFYGRDKEADDISSSDDADELDEAKRLQAIRSKKLQKQIKIAVEESESDSSASEEEDSKSHKGSSESENEGKFFEFTLYV